MKSREGQKYRVIDDECLGSHGIMVGDECVMCFDDGTNFPQFSNKVWKGLGRFFIDMRQLELIEERPERYASRELHGMDVLDLINHWNLNFSEGCILKYLLRDKGEDISDFKKIADYANREVKRLEGCK